MRKRIFAAAAVILPLALCLSAPGHASLVAEYDFNETSGTTAHPTVGSVNGTLQGDASFVSGGIEGNAVSMSTAGAGLVNFGANLFPTGPFTEQIWVNTTSSGFPLAYHYGGVVAGFFLNIGGSGDGCGSATGTVEFYVAYPCSGRSSINVADGTWHQLVGVYDGTRTLVYVDGQFQTESSGGNPLNTPPAGTDFLAGGLTVSGTPASEYTGLLDDLRVYDTALSASDILALYDAEISAVPEPTTLVLFGSAVGLLGFLRRRKTA